MKGKYRKYKTGGPVDPPREDLKKQLQEARDFYNYYLNSPKFKERLANAAPGSNQQYVTENLLDRLSDFNYAPIKTRELKQYDPETGKIVVIPEPETPQMFSRYGRENGRQFLFYEPYTAADSEGTDGDGTIKDREAVTVHELGHALLNRDLIDASSYAMKDNRKLFHNLMFGGANKWEYKGDGEYYNNEDLNQLQQTEMFRDMIRNRYGVSLPSGFGDQQSKKPSVDYSKMYNQTYRSDMQSLQDDYTSRGRVLPSRQNVITTHGGGSSEMIPDIYALRYMLKKNGIYDAGTEDFTIDHLKEMENNPSLKDEMLVRRLRENIKNLNKTKSDKETDQLFIDIMNQIAANNTKQKNYFA